MNSRLKEILSQVYELEGLLLVIENQKVNTNSLVYELVQKKSENIGKLTQSLSSDIFDEVLDEIKATDKEIVILNENNFSDNQEHTESEEEIHDNKEETEAVSESVEEDTAEETVDSTELDEENEKGEDSDELVAELDDVELPQEESDDDLPEIQNDIADNEDNAIEESVDSESFEPSVDFIENTDDSETADEIEVKQESSEDKYADVSDEKTEIQDNDDGFLEELNAQQPYSDVEDRKENISFFEDSKEDEYTDVAPEQVDAEEVSTQNEQDESVADEDDFETEEVEDDFDDSELDYYEEPEDETTVLRVGDVLQQNISKNLKKAFSLNDRFRFRRELFENSEVQMTNCLNIVEAMQSLGEAEEYFYNDLEWDKDSPEVKEFMSVIKKHFA